MNGNDRVLWWAYSQFMQYRNFNMIRNLAHGSPISPLLQIYLKVNFIPANRKLKFTETQLFSFQKSPLIIRPWPCGNLGNLVYLVYRFVTRLFIAKPLLQVHHISEEKALPQVHTLFLSNIHIFADFQYDSFGKSVWQTLLHCVLHKTCSYSQTLPQTKYHEVSLI